VPANDGKLIRLQKYPFDRERRKEVIKNLKKMAEEARVAVRTSGATAMRDQKLEKDKDISEDLAFKAQAEIKKKTEKYNHRGRHSPQSQGRRNPEILITDPVPQNPSPVCDVSDAGMSLLHRVTVDSQEEKQLLEAIDLTRLPVMWRSSWMATALGEETRFAPRGGSSAGHPVRPSDCCHGRGAGPRISDRICLLRGELATSGNRSHVPHDLVEEFIFKE